MFETQFAHGWTDIWATGDSLEDRAKEFSALAGAYARAADLLVPYWRKRRGFGQDLDGFVVISLCRHATELWLKGILLADWGFEAPTSDGIPKDRRKVLDDHSLMNVVREIVAHPKANDLLSANVTVLLREWDGFDPDGTVLRYFRGKEVVGKAPPGKRTAPRGWSPSPETFLDGFEQIRTELEGRLYELLDGLSSLPGPGDVE